MILDEKLTKIYQEKIEALDNKFGFIYNNNQPRLILRQGEESKIYGLLMGETKDLFLIHSKDPRIILDILNSPLYRYSERTDAIKEIVEMLGNTCKGIIDSSGNPILPANYKEILKNVEEDISVLIECEKKLYTIDSKKSAPIKPEIRQIIQSTKDTLTRKKTDPIKPD